MREQLLNIAENIVAKAEIAHHVQLYFCHSTFKMCLLQNASVQVGNGWHERYLDRLDGEVVERPPRVQKLTSSTPGRFIQSI